MSSQKRKYYRVIQWTLALSILFLVGGCEVYSSLRAKLFKEDPYRAVEDSCRQAEARRCVDELAHYYDSLQMLEYHHLYDSCELVLQAEWDSIMMAMADTVGMDNFVTALADSVIDYARKFMHAPYVHGGNGPKVFDCSGFTKYVFKRFGYDLKRTVPGQLSDGWKIIDKQDELRRGDLAFFGGRAVPTKMGHVAIVVDNNPEEHRFTFIHATLNEGITISASTEKYYRIRYMTACRILPE